MYVPDSMPERHCGRVMAYWKDGLLYVKCRHCKAWIKINLKEDKVSGCKCERKGKGKDGEKGGEADPPRKEREAYGKTFKRDPSEEGRKV